MKEQRTFLPVLDGQAIERMNPLSKKETVDIVAGRVCGCPGCRAVAEPTLKKNPLFRTLDFRKAQEMWQAIRKEGGKK